MTAQQPSTGLPPRFGLPSGDGGSGSPAFGMGGALAGVTIVAALLGGMVWSAASGRATTAERPVLFGGSIVLEDSGPLPVLDVATARITLRLRDVSAQVGASSDSVVQAVAISGGTVLLNQGTGSFNVLAKDNYVVDPSGSGVGLGPVNGAKGFFAIAAGSAAYIIRSAPKSTVSLIDESTVAAAARLEALQGAGTARPRAQGSRVTAAPSQAIAPRGFAALSGPVGAAPGSAAVSGSDLYVLRGGHDCSLDRLHPVAQGHNGIVVDTPADLGVACGSAAVEATPTMTAVAVPGKFVIMRGGARGGARDISAPGTATDTKFLPVTSSNGDAWFLGLSATGWSEVKVSSAGKVFGPLRLQKLSPAADPVAPALSAGRMYTLDQKSAGQPTLWTIDPATGGMSPVSVVNKYPAFNPSEKAAFSNVQILSNAQRVVFNNPGSVYAVVVFTDGSRTPVIVNKSIAVQVTATGPAQLSTNPATASRSRSSGRGTGRSGRVVPVVQAINPQLACAQTTQKPYAPLITSVGPSSGSALVAWSYQLLDQTDCEPRTWAVHVTALSGSHQPAQPTQVVQGQSQYLFTGLRPATTYQVTVTAYIRGLSTSSVPVTFRTSPRGPDAPLSVKAVSDGAGNWSVSWTPCVEAVHPSCVVPADTWNVIGSACGAAAFVGQPPAVQVPGGRTSVTINATALGLLGESLSFSVQGSLFSGLAGNPTSDHACTEAWRTPRASAIRLTDAGVPTGQSITATLQVATIGPPVDAFGSLSTQFVYRVGATVLGPTSATRVSIPGLQPGADYVPTVTVYPAGHPSASVTVAGSQFNRTLPWPSALQMAAATKVDATNPNAGSVNVSFPGLPAGPMTATGSFVCGSTSNSVAAQPIQNGSLSFAMDLVNFGGACTLSMTVSDTAKPDPYGVPSPALSAPFQIGVQPGYAFTDQISPACQRNFCIQEQIEVDYSGTGPLLAGSDWTYSVQSAGSQQDVDPCGVQPQPISTPPSFPLTVTLPLTCVNPQKADVTIAYRYLGDTIQADAGTPTGPPPATTTTTSTSTVPCRPTTTASGSTTSSTACPPPGPVGGAKLTRFSVAAPGDPDVRLGLDVLAAGFVISWPLRRLIRLLRATRAPERLAK